MLSTSSKVRTFKRLASLGAVMLCGTAAIGHAAHAQTAKPDFRNLRFDEVYLPSSRTSNWDDAIKAIPLLGASPLTLTFGGQLRWRGESYRDFNTTTQNDDNDQSRVQLLADLQAGNRSGAHARVFAEWRDAQSYGRTLPGGARTNDEDRHDMQNLFADVGYGASFVRYGRQEIALNRERLFGVPDWSNTRRGVQGTRAVLVQGAFAIDAMDVRPVIVRQTLPNRADSTTRFRTAAIGNAPNAKPVMSGLPAVWQTYWYDQEIRTPTALTRRTTTGVRAQWQWGATAPASSRALSIDVEGASQRGHVSTRDVQAWFGVADAQVTWRKARGAPTLTLGVEEASGENANTASTVETFFTLYPAAHSHGGYADVIGRANVRELHAISTWDVTKAVQLRSALYRFDRLRLDDGVYTKQNAVLRAASGSTERHAADEVDVSGIWKLTRHWRITFGVGIVEPGDFLKSTPGGAVTERWGYAGTSFTF